MDARDLAPGDKGQRAVRGGAACRETAPSGTTRCTALFSSRKATTTGLNRRRSARRTSPAHAVRCRSDAGKRRLTVAIAAQRDRVLDSSGADSSSMRSGARRALAFATACRPELGGNAATRCSSWTRSLWLGMGPFQILFLTATCAAVVGDGDSCSPTLPLRPALLRQ